MPNLTESADDNGDVVKRYILHLMVFLTVISLFPGCSSISMSRSTPDVTTLGAGIGAGTSDVEFNARISNASGYEPILLFFEVASDESQDTFLEGPVPITENGTYSYKLDTRLAGNTTYYSRAIIEYSTSAGSASSYTNTDLGSFVNFTLPQYGPYPTILPALQPEEIAQLQEEFDTMNPETSASIDPYGLLGYVYAGPINMDPSYVDPTEEESLQTVRDWLIKNNKFSGVNPFSQLETRRIFRVSDTGPWRIDIYEQYYKGRRVVSPSQDSFTIFSDSSVSQISGRYYLDVFIPEFESVSLEDAADSLIGLVLTWTGYTPEVNEFTVTMESLGELQPVQSIVPKETANGLSLFVCWEININGGHGPTESGWWTIYVDIVTGEIIQIDTNIYG